MARGPKSSRGQINLRSNSAMQRSNSARETRCRSHDVHSNSELSRSSVAMRRSWAWPPPPEKAPWWTESTARCGPLSSSSRNGLVEQRRRRWSLPRQQGISHAATVQELVERSLQSTEDRLLRQSRLPPPHAVDNISLPTQEPVTAVCIYSANFFYFIKFNYKKVAEHH